MGVILTFIAHTCPLIGVATGNHLLSTRLYCGTLAMALYYLGAISFTIRRLVRRVLRESIENSASLAPEHMAKLLKLRNNSSMIFLFAFVCCIVFGNCFFLVIFWEWGLWQIAYFLSLGWVGISAFTLMCQLSR